MASEEDANIDDIDEELARIERQIQELEEDAGEFPEPQTPDPETEDVDAPAPEEAFEGELDVEEEPGRLQRLRERMRSLKATSETDGEDEVGDEEDDTEDQEDAGGVAFWRSSGEDPDDDGEEDPDTEARPDADEQPEPTEPRSAEGSQTDPAEVPPEDETPPDEAEGTGAAPEEDEELVASDDEDAAHDDPEDEEGVVAGLMARFGSEDEPDAAEDPEPVAPEGRLDAGEDASLDEPVDPPEEPPTPPARGAGERGEDDEATDTRASALLARFQGGGAGDPEPSEAEDDDEDDDRGGLLVAVIASLLLLAGLAAAAYVLLPGASDDDELSATLAADAFTDDEGRSVATTGQALLLDASGSEGEVDEYVWDFDDGNEQTTTGATVEHTYDEAGSYTVEVTIRSAGGEDTAQLDVLVVQAPQAEAEVRLGGEPAAQPSTIGNNVFVGDQVTLDGSASSADPEQRITSYTWDIDGDGEPDATGREAQLGFQGVGAWAVNLTVRDDLGNEATDTRLVHVSDRLLAEDTIGPSTTEPETESYDVAVDEARLQARPVQLDVQLTYSASGNDSGDLPLQPEVDTDLDLNVTDPEGNVFQANDDEGQGEETLSLPAEDLANLGEWTVRVQQDNQNAGTLGEAEYELVIETLY